MKVRNLVMGSVLAAVIGLTAWYGWRWYTTPVPPEVPLDGVEKEMVQAIQTSRQEVRQQPRSGEAWGKLGMVLTANGYGQQGVDCFLQAERFDPGNPRWIYLRGVQLLADSPRQGIPLLRRALKLAKLPEDRAAILFRLALNLVEDGQLEEAEQRLRSLGEWESDGPRVHFGLGLLGIAREDRIAAREHLSALTDSPFARKQAYRLLATLTDENKEKARTYQQQSVRLPPDIPWPDPFEARMKIYRVDRMSRIARFWELNGQGHHQEALAFLRQFVAQSPDAEVSFTLGFTLYQLHEFEEAARVLRAATHFHPPYAKSYLFLGAALLSVGEKRYRELADKEPGLELFRQAVRAEDQALALQSDFGDAHMIRGRSLKYLGRTEEALRALREAVLCRPESADTHLYLGETLAEEGQLREGLQHLENALRLAEPNDPRLGEALKKWRTKPQVSSGDRR